MPLPSQQPRPGMRATKFSSGGGGRRRVRRRRFGAVFGIVALLLLAWWFWPAGDDKTPLKPQGARADGVPSSVSPVHNERTSPASSPSKAREDAGSALAARSEQRLTEAAEKAPPKSATRVPPSQPDDSSTDPVFTNPSPAPKEVAASLPEPPREAPPQTIPATSTPIGATSASISRAESALARNDPVEARDILNRALHDRSTPVSQRTAIRERLADVSESLTFSPRVLPGDATADSYTVQSGDVLAVIPRREGFRIDYRLIQRLNRLANANMIRPGQKLKVLYGPFHAVVDKSDFRMDIYADQRDTAGNRFYIRSFPVGLGEYGLTPVGEFRVPPSSVQEKLINPSWANPRTGEKFKADDPMNPIGERWIPLEGMDDNTRDMRGYGIHGTVQPESIGKEMSMGCIRMLPDDVELVYELLVPENSTVEIVD